MRIRLKGVTLAQIAVAKMHSGGYGAAQDNVRAHKWFSIAAELGDYHAASRRDDLAARMSADEIAEGNLLAKTWMENYATLQANQ